MIDRVPHFTSPSTLGDPQQVILIVLITLMGLAAAFGIFTNRIGTMLNCVAPAAVNSRTQTCQRVVDRIHGALAAIYQRAGWTAVRTSTNWPTA